MKIVISLVFWSGLALAVNTSDCEVVVCLDLKTPVKDCDHRDRRVMTGDEIADLVVSVVKDNGAVYTDCKPVSVKNGK